MRRMSNPTLLCLLLTALLLLAACQAEAPTGKAGYQIELTGTLLEAGIIDYAGLAMNVYPDPAANPCGDCADQPVSVYVGTGAEEVVLALAQAIERADDIWLVKEIRVTTLFLEEKELGQAEEPAAPSAPNGLTIQGSFRAAH